MYILNILLNLKYMNMTNVEIIKFNMMLKDIFVSMKIIKLLCISKQTIKKITCFSVH